MKRRWLFLGILILVIVILIIVFLRSSSIVRVCGPKSAGLFHDISYCRTNCNSDLDCKDTPCGAVNKDEKCDFGNILIQYLPKEVKCVNNECMVAK